jgi:hypothetical protein
MWAPRRFVDRASRVPSDEYSLLNTTPTSLICGRGIYETDDEETGDNPYQQLHYVHHNLYHVEEEGMEGRLEMRLELTYPESITLHMLKEITTIGGKY